MTKDKTQALLDYASTLTQLKEYQGNYTGCCPVHDEKTPSFYVYRDKFQAHCYGCDWKGDVFDLWREINGGTFLDAKKALGFWEESNPSKGIRKPQKVDYKTDKKWLLYEQCIRAVQFNQEFKITVQDEELNAVQYIHFCYKNYQGWKTKFWNLMAEIKNSKIRNYLHYYIVLNMGASEMEMESYKMAGLLK